MHNIIIGLGNPGSEYAQTRHNVGWLVLDELVRVVGAPGFVVHKKSDSMLTQLDATLYAKPQTFMNLSGQAVQKIIRFFNIQPVVQGKWHNLWVVHDDLDIKIGNYKTQFGTGPKAHNGLLSLYQHLGTDQFWHVRIGVDGRGEERVIPAREYVLQRFTPTEHKTITPVIAQGVQELQSITS